MKSEKGLDSLAHLVRGYFTMGGHHIQFNVVTAQTLREAQVHPEQYRNYFCDLSKTLQNEIIARTEHKEM